MEYQIEQQRGGGEWKTQLGWCRNEGYIVPPKTFARFFPNPFKQNSKYG